MLRFTGGYRSAVGRDIDTDEIGIGNGNQYLAGFSVIRCADGCRAFRNTGNDSGCDCCDCLVIACPGCRGVGGYVQFTAVGLGRNRPEITGGTFGYDGTDRIDGNSRYRCSSHRYRMSRRRLAGQAGGKVGGTFGGALEGAVCYVTDCRIRIRPGYLVRDITGRIIRVGTGNDQVVNRSAGSDSRVTGNCETV